MARIFEPAQDRRYTVVYTHKGIDIYTLAVAGLDVEKGYRVDDDRLTELYNTVGDAVDAIDSLLEEEQDGD